ncbi:putative Pilus assembly protein PilO [Candidatus Magnetomoraceae bacterium gMMP-15]
MKNKETIQLHGMVLFFIYGFIILATILLGVRPYYNKINEQKQKISTLKYQIKEQKKLIPIFDKLVKASKSSGSRSFQSNEDAVLPKDTRMVVAMMRQIAQDAGLKVISMMPELKSFPDNSKFLYFNSHFRGQLASFHRFMVRIGELPFLEHIEGIEILGLDRQRAFKLQIWLAYD